MTFGRFIARCVAATCLVLCLEAKTFAQPRAKIPELKTQREITKQLQDIHNSKPTDGMTKKQDTVRKLMKMAEDKSLPSDELYVILTTTISLAKEVGDFASWNTAVHALGFSFELDARKEKTRLIKDYLESAKPPLKAAVVDASLEMAHLAAQEHQYAEATSLLVVTEAAVRRSSAAETLKTSVTEARREIAMRETDHKALQSALTKLDADAEDPMANMAAGRWHWLHAGDWPAALPHLAKCSNPKWKTAAELELAAPLDATAQVAIGDAWWDIGQAESSTTKTALLVHAGEWYSRAQPRLDSAIKKQVVAKRLDEISPLKGKVATKPTGLSNSNAPPIITTATQSTNPGEWIDLLEWSEGVDWAQRGIDWNSHLDSPLTRSGATMRPLAVARFPLAAVIDGDYQLEIDFTRRDSMNCVCIYFPVATHTAMLMLASLATGGASDGLQFINGAHHFHSTTIRHPSRVVLKARHRVRITVRSTMEQSQIVVDLDDANGYIKWDGPTAALTNVTGPHLYPRWQYSMVRHVWLASWDDTTTFHKSRIQMLSGTIRRDTITQDDREQDRKNGIIRLVGEKAVAAQVGYTQFVVNQIPMDLGQGITESLWPLITRDFKVCDDFYGAHAPSRITCPIPSGAKSFSAIGYNDSSRTAKYLVYVDGKVTYDSGVTDVAITKIDIPAEASMLELVTDSVGDQFRDHTHWCYPRFHSVPRDKLVDTLLDGKPGQLKFALRSSSVGAGKLTHNEPINTLKSVPVHFRDVQPCHEFIYAHAPSSVLYQVPEGMSRFTAIGYNVRSHHVKYEVWVDEKRIYESPQAGIVPIDVKLPPGTKTIELRINDLGNYDADDSMWCYPRLHRK